MDITLKNRVPFGSTEVEEVLLEEFVPEMLLFHNMSEKFFDSLSEEAQRRLFSEFWDANVLEVTF